MQRHAWPMQRPMGAWYRDGTPRGCGRKLMMAAAYSSAQTEALKASIAAACSRAQEEALASAQRASHASQGIDDRPQLRPQLLTAIEALQRGLVERDTEVRLLLLAALAQEHILFIGPPGTAKSELGRRLAQLYRGAFFERLLTRFSVPEELFGPLSMKALEHDEYKRKTTGYLPSASVAFVDEIFKANSAILNSLLTIINERLFDNGSVREKVPLRCLVGASNELPESEELDALYDRFLLRRQVAQVSPAGLMELLSSPRSQVPQATALASPGSQTHTAAPLLVDDSWAGLRGEAMALVEVPSRVLQLLADLRKHMQEEREPPTYISDRRLVKAVVLLQVAAWTCGRRRVLEFDALLLRNVLCYRPEDEGHVTNWLLQHIAAEDGLRQPRFLLKSLFGRACAVAVSAKPDADLAQEVEALRSVLLRKLAGVLTLMQDDVTGISTHLWFGHADARRFVTALKPRLKAAATDTQRLLAEVIGLQHAIEAGLDSAHLADLLPGVWADFIRNADMSDVRPLGTRSIEVVRSKYSMQP
ncbi:hypothetical protein ACKKBF_B10515 [Auxenochlorella protothecoides x Auxenochlorella symbiontica]